MAITFELLETSLLRGRGPQRIRKVFRMNMFTDITHPPCLYVPGQGFSNPNAALPELTELLGTIRNATVRTVEPRIVVETDVGFPPGTFYGTYCILDFNYMDIGHLVDTKELGIRAYGVLFKEGVSDSGLTEVLENTILSNSHLFFEIEYTPFSGQEG